MAKKKAKDFIGFWKFLIVLSILLNVINLYYISGTYLAVNSGAVEPVLSQTDTGMTGYFVLGSPLVAGMLFSAIVLAYLTIRKVFK